MEYEQWREKWLVKSIHYLKMIREDFEKGTGRKVEECRVELIDGEIRFFWNDSPKPWQTARVGEIDPKDVFITLYRLFQLNHQSYLTTYLLYRNLYGSCPLNIHSRVLILYRPLRYS